MQLSNHKPNAKYGLVISWIYLVAILAGSTFAANPKGPAPVTINKCCRIGEQLDKTKVCMPGGSEKWLPKVFLVGPKKYYSKEGEAPQHMKIFEQALPETCSYPEYFYGANNLVLISNGSLFIGDKNIMAPPEDYCVDQNAALVCYHKDMDALTLPQILSHARKCCGPSSIYSKHNATCINLDRSHELFAAPILKSPQVDILFGFPQCELHDFAIAGLFDDADFNDHTGALMMADSKKVFVANQFCLEYVLDGISFTKQVFACSEHFPHIEAPTQSNDVRFSLYSIGLLISVVFLVATLAAGFLVPSNHHVLHWRCQTNYIVCLLIGDLLLAITQLAGNGISEPFCSMIAIFMHFSFLAAFFWLNTMCFNIWWTFRDFRPTSLEKSQESCRLRIYHVWAWGVPLLIAVVAAILDQMPHDDSILRPRFGEKRCWFYGNSEILAYFFGPIGMLLIINVLLFLSTVRELTCGRWKPDDVNSTDQHRTALERVCVKLIIVMGLTWVADVLSWFIGGPDYLWYVTDLINALQGLFIFIVVGCQPQVWTAFKRLFSSRTGRNVMTTTNGPQHSSSSHGLPSIGESVTNNTTTNTTTTNGKVPLETVC